jgi:hypothetical protein
MAKRSHMVRPRIEHKKPRKIVGFSLSPSLADEVKTEAARRQIALKDLFAEIWTLYKSTKTSGQ